MKRRLLSALLVLCLFISILPAATAVAEAPFVDPMNASGEEGVSLNSLPASPRITVDSNSPTGRTMTWDCVLWGSYPQGEVLPDYENFDTYVPTQFHNSFDYIIDTSLYGKLQNSSGWVNNEITIDGYKYVRMRQSDALYSCPGSQRQYNWTDSTTYHYFRYMPIKWLVLRANGNNCMLLSEKVLDDISYSKVSSFTWDTSIVRSFLNGYGASENVAGKDYTGCGFLQRAFTSSQRLNICGTYVGDCIDQVTLSTTNLMTWLHAGFSNDPSYADASRMTYPSVYAKARGVQWSDASGAAKGKCYWWTINDHGAANKIHAVCSDGTLQLDYIPNSLVTGVRPCIYAILASNDPSWELTDPVSSPAYPLETISSFRDVPESAYFYKPVLWAVKESITSGTSSTTFSPDQQCTRGQVVTFLWRAAGGPEPGSTKNPFKDVSADQYFYKPVLWAVEQGITAGTSSTTFSPDQPCTRGQVVTFLWRFAGKKTPSGSNCRFTDVPKSAYFYQPVLWAVENGITAGTYNTTFSPEQTCTRGQVVTFLWRYYGKPEP